MSAAEVLASLVEGPVGDLHGRLHATVPRERWVPVVQALWEGLRPCFDLLTVVDDGDDGLRVVLHLWVDAERVSVLLSTGCPAADPQVPSVAHLVAGAAWHERHAAEMFGVGFAGAPSDARLLLPDSYAGPPPLRKDAVLAARAAQDWPGTVEPGAGGSTRRSRRGARPLGVPEPGTWGTA